MNKQQLKQQDKIVKLLEKEHLSADEIHFIYENYIPQRGGKLLGQFFTPFDLGREVAIQAQCGQSVIDLCGGIGMLTYAHILLANGGILVPNRGVQYAVVELDLELIRVGRKLLPFVKWYHGSIFDKFLMKRVLEENNGRFDVAITNPPYGLEVITEEFWLNYSDVSHLAALEVSSKVANLTVAILPSVDVPNIAKANLPLGANRYEKPTGRVGKFLNLNPDISFSATCVDCSIYKDKWVGASPDVELVLLEKEE